MDSFEMELNNILVDTFRTILKVEESMLKTSGRVDLSISEVHMLEAVGKNNNSAKTVSDIAQDLGITLSSVTIGVNKLEKKGYVQKLKAVDDGRAVAVSLTREGIKIDRVHRLFHLKMVSGITENLDEKEKQTMLSGIRKLDDFFRRKMHDTEA